MSEKKILVTGAAGFIGFHVVKALTDRGDTVIGLDNISDYYDVNLKFDRLKELDIDRSKIENGQLIEADNSKLFSFIKMDLKELDLLKSLFAKFQFDVVINLAAQAGVRYSLEKPQSYIDSNIQGFINILECCRHNNTGNLIYASSSSVYGGNTKMPFSVHDNVDHPISLYAATKKSNELMAHTYSHLFNIPTTGLRFFTVYGPWGRPDMALSLFAEAIMNDRSIKVFNEGKMERDFTYIDDIVDGIIKVADVPATGNTSWSGENPDPGTSRAPYRIYNIGNNQPVQLMEYIQTIERHIGKEAKKEYLPLQPGDVVKTFADISDLQKDFGYKPSTNIDEGIGKFVKWFKAYHK